MEVKFKNFVYPVLIQPSQVDELNRIEFVEKGVKVGAAVTLNDFQDFLRNEIANKPGKILDPKIFKIMRLRVIQISNYIWKFFNLVREIGDIDHCSLPFNSL